MDKLQLYSNMFLIEKGAGMPVKQRIGNPIPELLEKEKIAIFLLGPPASGKSTFVKSVILPLNNTFKQINPDDISILIQKWKEEGGKNDFIPNYSSDRKSKEKSQAYITQLIKFGKNFIYDTTGRQFNDVSKFNELAKNNNYKVIFIHVLVDLNTAIKRNTVRMKKASQPPVDDEYIITSHKNVVQLMKNYMSLINWDSDSYYAVTTKNFELVFYKISKSGSVLKYFNRSYNDINMNLNDFYKRLNEGLRKFYGYNILLENLGIKKENYVI